jgi:hypothetical protein
MSEIATTPAPAGATEVIADWYARLTEPFDLSELKFKPQAVKGDRALAVAYVDARVVQDRLDDVLGCQNWQDSYEPAEGGSVVCRLALRVNGEWITKTDVGSPSEQPDQGDRLKAAYSDALKRAAVKFGVGRYIYRLPAVWTNYDPQKKQFTQLPAMPNWALPRTLPAAQNSRQLPATGQAKAAPPARKVEPPTTAAEFAKRVRQMDAQLTEQKWCVAGFFIKAMEAALAKRGTSLDAMPDAMTAGMNEYARKVFVAYQANHAAGKPPAGSLPAPQGPAGVTLDQAIARLEHMADECKAALGVGIDWWLVNTGGLNMPGDVRQLSAEEVTAMADQLEAEIAEGIPY